MIISVTLSWKMFIYNQIIQKLFHMILHFHICCMFEYVLGDEWL